MGLRKKIKKAVGGAFDAAKDVAKKGFKYVSPAPAIQKYGSKLIGRAQNAASRLTRGPKMPTQEDPAARFRKIAARRSAGSGMIDFTNEEQY